VPCQLSLGLLGLIGVAGSRVPSFSFPFCERFPSLLQLLVLSLGLDASPFTSLLSIVRFECHGLSKRFRSELLTVILPALLAEIRKSEQNYIVPPFAEYLRFRRSSSLPSLRRCQRSHRRLAGQDRDHVGQTLRNLWSMRV
jgi:hypothetical protein